MYTFMYVRLLISMTFYYTAKCFMSVLKKINKISESLLPVSKHKL